MSDNFRLFETAITVVSVDNLNFKKYSYQNAYLTLWTAVNA